jgi:single stranded DNA-binding protein
MYMNQLTIIGFTGQDAELHYTQNGTPVTTLSVATKGSWKNDQEEWQSRTEWHRVVAFGKLAEYCGPQKQRARLSGLLHQAILMMQAAKHRRLHNAVTGWHLVPVVARR